FEPVDLEHYDLVVAMDYENQDALKALDPMGLHHPKIVTLREFDTEPGDGEVPDPYFGGIHGFENVYEMVSRCCENLVEHLRPSVK
ncbi:MAG: low molecular weight phosphotyrosine protein phosphatase, partial [Balneolales bacterium]